MRSRSVILFSALIAGCTTAGARPRADEPGPAAEPRQAERVTGPAEVATGNLERSDLDAEATVERSFRLVPIDGADVVLAVAEEPAGRTTRWRTFDAHGVASTPVVLEGFRLAGAVATPDVRLVVSNGVDLELRRLDGTLAGGPYPLRPEAVVALGHRRVAFLEERALPTPPAAEKPKGDADAGRGAASGSASTPAPAAGTRAKEAIAKGPAAKDKPANDKPAKGRAAKGKPANDKPAKGRTAKGKPANEGPTKSRAAKDKSANDKPAVVAATSPALAKKGPPPSPPLKPTPVKLWVHLVGDDGTLMDATETNVAFERPMPAMGLVAARGTTRGARLLWFEPEPPAKDDINQSPRAQLMAGALDSLGHRQGAPTPLVGGPRQYGFIDGHLRPRLFTLGDEGLYVGRHEGPAPDGRKRRWEARWLGAGAVEAPDATWVVDPRRVLERRPPRVPEMKLFERIRKASPGLVEPQSAEEPGRVAWAGKRGYFLAEGRLHSVAPDSGRIEPVPHPFVEQRATLAFGGVASDGSAVAATPRELSTIAVDGTVKRQALAPELSGLVPFQVAKVGARWLGVFPAPLDRAHPGGAKVVRIEAVGELAAPSLEAYPGSVALVGGATHAHWVTLDGDRLGLARLAADGELTRLATHPAPIRGGLAAVPRRAGGVLVVGPDRNGNGSIAAALDATGRLGPVTPLGLGLAPGRIELASLPEGGALAWVAPDPRTPDRSPRGVAWLDDDGRLLAEAPWPDSEVVVGRPCANGRNVPRQLPTPEPGRFVAIALADACLVSRPEWTRGGVRWLGLRRDGAGEHAERVVFSASGPAPQATSGTTSFAGVAPSIAGSARRACPPDMVHVTGRLCVDRYESQLVDAWGVALSPYHATSPQVVRQVLDEWTFGRLLVGDLHARAMPLPPLLRPVDSVVTPVATSRPGTVPTSQISGAVAEAACRSAGKRLCSLDEWTLACRGEEGREFPYGTAHEQGACNVNGDAHPAAVLHGNAALGHLDPRLNLVEIDGVPLLSTTGASPRCASRWGDDAIFDMVGNLDEWVDDEEGTFAGGFYARGTRRGCGSVITSHPRRYFDYSLGTRCCLTP